MQPLTYQKVTPESLPTALEIIHRIWPNAEVDEDFLDKPLHPEDDTNVTWLVYAGDELIGLTGIFTFDEDEPGYDDAESVWMDWFAILPEYRKNHYGSQVLLDTIEYCKKLKPYKYFRIDTTYFENRPTVGLYDKYMPLREEYTAEDTPGKKQHYLIYSCSLDNSPVKPWNNHFLDLGDDSEGGLII